MTDRTSELLLRVRYSETDQMGTFYNSRALEWFECGRTQWLREAGVAYVDCEARGLMLPLVEAYVRYAGRARYDDELRVRTRGAMEGRARGRVDIEIVPAGDGRPVATGHTVHAGVDATAKPMRPPSWFLAMFEESSE